MKLQILAAAAVVLALGGVASAQPGAPTATASSPSSRLSSAQDNSSRTSGYVTAQRLGGLNSGLQQYSSACAEDRRDFCADKLDSAVGRCLADHRLSLSVGCRQSMVGPERSRRGGF